MIVHLILERQIDGSVLSRGRWWVGAHPAPVRENIDDSRNRGSGWRQGAAGGMLATLGFQGSSQE